MDTRIIKCDINLLDMAEHGFKLLLPSQVARWEDAKDNLIILKKGDEFELDMNTKLGQFLYYNKMFKKQVYDPAPELEKLLPNC